MDSKVEIARLRSDIQYGIPDDSYLDANEWLASVGTATPEQIAAKQQRIVELGGTVVGSELEPARARIKPALSTSEIQAKFIADDKAHDARRFLEQARQAS